MARERVSRWRATRLFIIFLLLLLLLLLFIIIHKADYKWRQVQEERLAANHPPKEMSLEKVLHFPFFFVFFPLRKLKKSLEDAIISSFGVSLKVNWRKSKKKRREEKKEDLVIPFCTL